MEFRSPTIKTLISNGVEIKEFDNYVTYYDNENYIIISDSYGGISIYNNDWKDIGYINCTDELGWKVNSLEPFQLNVISNNLLGLYYGDEFTILNLKAEVLFKLDGVLKEDNGIEMFSYFPINENEGVVVFDSYNRFIELYKINLETNEVIKGPNLNEIAKKNQLRIGGDAYYSKLSGYLYVRVLEEETFNNTFFITDFQESFVTVSKEFGIFDWQHINPLHINGLNPVILYSFRYENEFKLFDIETGTFIDQILVSDFIGEDPEKKIHITSIIENYNGFTLEAIHNKSEEVYEHISIQSKSALNNSNFKLRPLDQITNISKSSEMVKIE